MGKINGTNTRYMRMNYDLAAAVSGRFCMWPKKKSARKCYWGPRTGSGHYGRYVPTILVSANC